jgi:hypothetical protein
MNKTRRKSRPSRGVVTKAQAAGALGVTPRTLYRWLKSGRLERRSTGRRLAGGQAEYGVSVVQSPAHPKGAAAQPACSGTAEGVPWRVTIDLTGDAVTIRLTRVEAAGE